MLGNSSLVESYGIKIDVSRSLNLPTICGVNTPLLNACLEVGHSLASLIPSKLSSSLGFFMHIKSCKEVKAFSCPIPSGMVPFNSFEERNSSSKSDRVLIDDGIGPENEFLWRSKEVKAFSCPIHSGMDPFNSFEERCSLSKNDKVLIDDGIRPENEFPERSRDLNLVKFPNDSESAH
ncbi:hypothetical protein GH714_039541 [Hevea brasiliensis]|uniref:Uncharacterized protein n=1 Tax=Hevea brasiliensis TaxID=3981 RepID=A0A6A6KMN6_HEVBR|nr:hypothetical protein GH714_039541 [Hevea brasiliensis]